MEEVYDNYLGGVIIPRDNAYEVIVGPWRTMIFVENNKWLAAHDEATNWRLDKAEKFRSFLAGRTSVPVEQKVLPELLKLGYGPFIEIDDDYMVQKRQFCSDRVSYFWSRPQDEQVQQADEVHRQHASDPRYAATEWGAISGRSDEMLILTYNRGDIGNLAYMAQHAPEPHGALFRGRYEALTKSAVINP